MDAESEQDGRPAGSTRRAVLGASLAGGIGAAATRTAIPAGAAPVPAAAPTAAAGRLREYWIQAESFRRKLAPTGRDGMTGRSVSGDTYTAIGYRAYTPGWGNPLAPGPDIGPNDGIPGPVLRARVGDRVRVNFRNHDTHYRFPHSMHPHGLRYDEAHDGAWIAMFPGKPGTAVPAGESYTYEWTAVPGSAGTWVYHDHSMPQSLTRNPPKLELNVQLGLFGIIAVTDSRTTAAGNELISFFHDLYADDIPGLAHDFDCFNGRAFLGNTPTYRTRLGQRVRWRVATLGSEFHVFHLHGHRWQAPDGAFTDSQILGPSTTLTLEYHEDNPGHWLYHCHVADHMNGGMIGLNHVTE